MGYDFESSDKDRFSLHDCYAQEAELADHRLIFRFPDGIYCHGYSDDWPNTGRAEVTFPLVAGESATFYQFVDDGKQTVRRQIELRELLEKINAGEWQLEFAYRYDGFREVLYTCWLWVDRPPWSYECQLFIGTQEDTVFRWDAPEQ